MSIPRSIELAALARAVRQSTLKRLRRVPPGRENHRLTDASMSFADLARHLIDADQWLVRKLDDETLTPMHGDRRGVCIERRDQWESLLAELEDIGGRRAALIESMNEDDLARRVTDERFGGEVTIWWVIVRGNLDHEIHHRGQIALMLQVVGAEGDSRR